MYNEYKYFMEFNNHSYRESWFEGKDREDALFMAEAYAEYFAKQNKLKVKKIQLIDMIEYDEEGKEI